MDWIISLVIGVISALGGGTLVFFRQEKKAKEIKNEQAALEIWRDLLDRSDADSREKARIIEEQSAKIAAMGDKIEELRIENADLQVRNATLRWQKCTRNGCLNRQPPREFETE